jgi:hypothetical protein
MESWSLVLLSRAVAAAEAAHVGVAELFLRAGIERDMVGVSWIVLGDGGENVVVEPPLVLVHVLGGLIEHEESSNSRRTSGPSATR